ncbi:hypothetical protein BJ508DRAFT_110041 [Ascobolus immersus RN42]|uniref:Uncharacterized protein n=1 Tax=Ascobolus immersus RN42 TaxID=1160509 RepID=A0A3N4IC58_ASCIM|nr:hypothetical protein BJ508DRAFT_110041 [Ascobolus immersus RN42]
MTVGTKKANNYFLLQDSKEFGLGADPEFGLYFEPGNHDTLLDQLESKEKVELLKDGGATERVLDADTRKAEFMRRIHLASEEACQALAYAGCPVKDVSALWDGYVGQPIGPLAVDR